MDFLFIGLWLFVSSINCHFLCCHFIQTYLKKTSFRRESVNSPIVFWSSQIHDLYFSKLSNKCCYCRWWFPSVFMIILPFYEADGALLLILKVIIILLNMNRNGSSIISCFAVARQGGHPIVAMKGKTKQIDGLRRFTRLEIRLNYNTQLFTSKYFEVPKCLLFYKINYFF
jgi:hypothetical protein